MNFNPGNPSRNLERASSRKTRARVCIAQFSGAAGIGRILVMVAAFSLSFLLVGNAETLAATLYVDQANSSCSDLGKGTSQVPFCTISKAASVVTAGTKVVVRAGT